MKETVHCPYCNDVLGLGIQDAYLLFEGGAPIAVVALDCADCEKRFYMTVEYDGDRVSVSVREAQQIEVLR
jgi:hypothetical protein